MPLHTKVDGDGPEGRLAVDTLFANESTTVPKHRMPDTPAPLGLGSSIGPSFISLRGVPA